MLDPNQSLVVLGAEEPFNSSKNTILRTTRQPF